MLENLNFRAFFVRIVAMTQPDSSILQALIQCDSTGRARLQETGAT